MDAAAKSRSPKYQDAVNDAAADVIKAMVAGGYKSWSAQFAPIDGTVWRVRVSSRKATRKDYDDPYDKGDPP